MAEQNVLISWPPQYILKRHARSRHVKFKASQKMGLEIVVPIRFNLKYLPEILETHKTWIIKKLSELQQRVLSIDKNHLPDTIPLNSIHQVWKVSYLQTDSKSIRLYTRPAMELVLLGNTRNALECKKLLVAWIKKQAKIHLPRLLQQASEQTQLSYYNVSIRNQQTRWGSCTSEKNISLNYKLLFLPEILTYHILIHELCHTVYLNHSIHFWKLVSQFDPHWKMHSKEIRKADHYLPHWII